MIVFFGVLFLFVIPVVVYLLRRDVRRHISGGERPQAKPTTVVYQR